MADPVAELRSSVTEAAAGLRGSGGGAEPTLERPKKPEFGDYSTNAAMLLAPVLREPPRAVAERLGGELEQRLAGSVARVDVAGPGFLNLFMSDAWHRESLVRMLAAGDAHGSGVARVRERILVEFVSANPTGPITVASGRHAAYGDALCRLLEFAGHEVGREYYVNDQGTQVRRLGESIRARARGEEPPEDGYKGAYVADLAGRIPDAAGGDPDELARRGVELMMESVRGSLERFRVRFDGFFSERRLHEERAIERAVEHLRGRGHVYEREGALWLRTTTFGDDKDRVLRRSGGEYTYFAADIAYHEDKRARGYDRYIDVWGADHHGYVARMRAAWEAFGGDRDSLELAIMQLVNLVEGGERVQMSKREGEFVTLDDLASDIGVDAARWFLVQRSHETTLDLDLSLARAQSQDNPVYYCQYAHARIASILRKAGEELVEDSIHHPLTSRDGDEMHPSERAIVKQMLDWPAEVAVAAERRAPHRVVAYVHDLAQGFSAFYRDCKVVGSADERFRIALCVQAKRMIARCLGLVGVEAPERM